MRRRTIRGRFLRRFMRAGRKIRKINRRTRGGIRL